MKELLSDLQKLQANPTFCLIALVVSVIIIATYFWLENRANKKRRKRIQELQNLGAFQFIREAVQLKRMVDRFNEPYWKNNAERCQQARLLQESILSEGRRTIEGTVCDERVIGWVHRGVLQLAVAKEETREALEESLRIIVNRETELHFGLRLKLDFK